MRGSAQLVVVALTLAGCATTGPRFGQEVAASFAQQPMRKLTTREAEIYYPEQARESALRIAARLTLCLTSLRAHAVSHRQRGKLLLYLTSANFNNAYVDGQYGGEPLHAVLPLFATDEGFHFDNLPDLSVGDIGCHELLHFVHFEQVEGFWRWVNLIEGDVFGPQNYLERWFTEGLAQYYEGRLEHHTGRPHSPLYRAELESGLALRKGHVGPGDLTLFERELYPSSGAYLAGLHFIEFLADRYGEERLWELIDMEGSSIVAPLGVALRFKAVYGLSLGALVDQWSHALEARPYDRVRPPQQVVLRRDAGYSARLAAAPDGTLALISAGRDEVPMLRLLEPDGRVRAEQYLNRLTPDRDWVSAGPSQMSGLSFTQDSKLLYLMNDDLTEVGDQRAQLWKIDARTGQVLEVLQDLGGAAGSVTPDGRAYVFVAVSPGRAELTRLDLATHAREVLAVAEPGTTYAAPAVSPDGRRIAFSRGGPQGFDLVVREPGGELRQVTFDGRFNYGPRWVDDGRLVFLREKDGRAQAHFVDLETGAASVVTDAPFSVRDLAPAQGRLAFLNRDGWGWSVDAAPLASLEPAELTPGAAAAGEPPVARSGEAPVAVEKDEPYSGAEKLAIPLLRQPSLVNLSASCGTGTDCVVYHSYALTLAGRDRLSFHNWELDAYASFPDGALSFSGGYVNETLAPWAISAGAGYDQFDEALADASVARRVRQVSGAVGVGRSFWSTPVSLSLTGIERWASDHTWSRFIGPSASFSWFAGDSTPYGGLRRALGFFGAANFYPRALGSRFDLFDLSVSVSGAVPLPGLKRQSLVLSLDGRAVHGAAGALQVGGIPRGVDLASAGDTAGPGTPSRILPQRFALAVRGYEDYAIGANHAVVAGARWRYPFIIDRGFASLLYLLPSIFFRQFDVELFGSAAVIDNPRHPWLRAAGAALYLRLGIMGAVGLSFYYRAAVRFDEHLPVLHAVGFAFE